MQEAEWFKDWFNSPYYHILYKNRDHSEAAMFIDKLSEHLKLNANDVVWDLACGMGRHSLYLNKKGFKVVGTDLSVNSITSASQNSNEHLDFYVHDMRTPFRTNYFTHVFNLFTSIGYFENYKDNAKVFKNIHAALKPKGLFVIDFFNADKVLGCMVDSEKKVMDGIEFKISKKAVLKQIVKRIEFTDQGHNYFFEEKVSVITKADFENLAKNAGFNIVGIFGDYNLNEFNSKTSDRLILILEK